MKDSPANSTPLSRPTAAIAVLVLGLLITFGVWALALQTVQERDRIRFEGAVEESQTAIEQRMETYLNALRDSAGLFTVSEHVSRSEWHDYVTTLKLLRRYPGVQGIGYTVRIPAARLAAHERAIRAEGFPHYRVWPATPRADYFSIVYLEPFNWRNQRAFGYDMATEPTRRAAMDRARDTGMPALTGRVTLVQETPVGTQAGFLIYVPVYQRDLPTGTVAARRAALLGFVYSPFRADDLFKGIFGRQEAHPLIDFEVFDDRHVSGDTLLHDHNPRFTSAYHDRADTYRPRFEDLRATTIAGRPWTIHYSSLPAFDATSNQELPVIALTLGLLVTVLLVWITWVLASGRERAVAIANDMTVELRQADRSKDEFLSVISHELRTPLNFIMGFASILQDEVAGPLNAQQHDFLGKILSGVDRMLLLVNDLLDFAKIQAGKFTLSPEMAPLRPLVDEVLTTLRPLADQKGLGLSAQVPEPFPAYVDERRLVQVLTNLVGNAIKFTPPGGKIHLAIRREGGSLRLEVTDTGIGIAPEDVPKLFTRFRQLDMSNTRQAGGTGLGLSISKAIVEAHGGEIGVRSQKGVGSTFWFTVPTQPPAAAAHA